MWIAACRTRLVSSTHERGTVGGMAKDEPKDRLAAVRWNIARHRKAAELSQADVAERMTGRGAKWFPQTVQKVENGTRTLRFDEAVNLAESLGVEIWELLEHPAEEVLSEIAERRADARKRMRKATKDYLLAQEQAAVLIDLLGDMGHEGADTILLESPIHAVLDVLRESCSVPAERLRQNRLLFHEVNGLTEESIMTRREPEHFGPSPEGTNPRLQELLERRREWWGEESTDGVDPEAS